MNKIFSIIIISILLGVPSTIFAADSASDVRINKFELIWSADTYTPYNYQGRNLPTIGSKVIIDVVIDTSGGNPLNLKYSWFLEDIFQQSKSGYGKDSFYFYVQQRPGAYHTVRLQIFNDDRTVFEEKSIQIPIAEPEIIFYSSNGNSHFSNQASTIYTFLAGKTFSFVARPYFFSINKLTDLIFEWTFSGKESIISSDYDASIFNLTISDKNNGQTIKSDLWVNVKNILDETQNAFKSMKINIY
ncbi:hypothetical protein KKF60_03295 [Patescibacteria group bacterium]|nr:hypothetical protein [Patescibacteria group bacterium]MBU4458893.1 hypothetical protein [Patescibacteria group bacterium]MCG2696175.1 hypothetical protein [Candidatus Portnoybacteria bacterium]